MQINQETGKVISEIGDKVNLDDVVTDNDFILEDLITKDYLFEYFKQLSTKQTSFNVSFNDWLRHTRGWTNKEGFAVYEKTSAGISRD